MKIVDYASKPITLAIVLFSTVSAAAPTNSKKLEDVVVWKTITSVVWTTIHVTTTIYETQSQASPTIPSAATNAPITQKETAASQHSQSVTPAATIQIVSGSSRSSSGYSGSCSKNSPCVGQATYYETATSANALSNCGTTNDGSTENVVALPVGIMTAADCGKLVTVTYNGVAKTGTVVDTCRGCVNTSIDLSSHFFGELADMAAGCLSGVSWYIN